MSASFPLVLVRRPYKPTNLEQAPGNRRDVLSSIGESIKALALFAVVATLLSRHTLERHGVLILGRRWTRALSGKCKYYTLSLTLRYTIGSLMECTKEPN